MAKVSIISVNYKEYEASRRFLKACFNQTHKELELILVDNESDPEAFSLLQKDFPEVKLIADEKNKGFAGGNNLGIQQAKGDYLFFLNNDTVPPPELVENMLKGFQAYQDAGGISPKILYLQDKKRIQYAGYTEIHPFTGRNQTIGKEELDQGQHDKARETAYLHGAACMLKREIIEEVGMMPEMYFLYYEELDWSVAIRNAGYKLYYFPEAAVYHHASLSTGQDSPLKTYYYYRNRVLFMRRNVKGLPLGIFLLYFFLILSPLKLLGFFLKGKNLHAKSFLKAITWHLSGKKTWI